MSQFTNIAEAVDEQAQKNPSDIAIYFPYKTSGEAISYQSYTFLELKENSDYYAKGLLEFGFNRGDHVALMVKPSLEFFALTFALFKAGLVPTLIDPGIGIKNLKECLAEAQPVGFIGITKAQIARIIFGWAKSSIKKVINVNNIFLPGTDLSKIKSLGMKSTIKVSKTEIKDRAAIIFTSGSTGIPKGVLYTHENFLTQIKLIGEKYKMTAGDIDLPTFPLFALFNPAFGMTSVIPKMDFTKPGSVNPKYIVAAIKEFNIANMFGSPALLNRVGRYIHTNDIKLPSLKRILSAGAPMNPKTLRLFTKSLNENTYLYTPYGATECLPVASVSSHKVLSKAEPLTAKGHGVCVGETFDGVEVKILKISDEVVSKLDSAILLPKGEVGEIIVKGANVTQGYFNRDKATKLSKIQDEDGFWHRMGDIGYFDQEGDLWFLGRKSHRVILENETLFTIQVEGVFNAHKDIFRTALVGVSLNGKIKPVLCIEFEKDVKNQAEIIAELKRLKENYDFTKKIEHFLVHPSFPVDIRHNAKIFREKLGPWAKEQLS